jgi:5-(carboxyamino)imidazole ribonucleotide synthase
VIGVVGAGQLARMTHQAAIPLGLELRFLADRSSDPAAAVAPGWQLGSAMDPAALASLATDCDVVTFDHEVVDLDALDDLERTGAVLRPSASVLRIVADKAEMRKALADAGLPLPPFETVTDREGLEAVIARWDEVVVKRARGGYDGRGVFVAGDRGEARTIAEPLLAAGERLVVEPFLALETELAVVAARRPGGDTVVYDPVTTVQVDGMCRRVVAPALDDRLDTARELAVRIASELGVVGLLAVELFSVAGSLLVNELAVRPHNTGHHTIEAAVTSQFENHVRAVADLPLGSTSPTCTAAAMVNVVGGPDGRDPRDLLSGALALDAGAHVHLYGKEPRPDRKLGHVTVCDDDRDRAVERAERVARALGTPEEPA